MKIKALLFGLSHKQFPFVDKKTQEQKVFDVFTLSIMIDRVLYSISCTEEAYIKADELLIASTNEWQDFVQVELVIMFTKWKYDSIGLEVSTID